MKENRAPAATRLILRDRLAPDPWHWLEDGEPPPGDGGRHILSLVRWLENRDAALAAEAGLWLHGDADPAPLLPDLDRIPLIAVRFPVFTDGRGYSLARLLRRRHGFCGELRAVGDVLRDQIAALSRCGFDAFLPRADQDPQDCLAALAEISVRYQE